MTVGPGLRERKKRETRRLLAEVATRMFAERGFDEVTVAEIAAAANVSEKTVFNYFATKEDLVLEGRQEVEARLVAAVRERAPGESLLAAVRRHTLSVAGRMDALPVERRAAFRKVLQSSPAVRARMRQMSLRTEDELVRVIAEETAAPAGDPMPRVVADVLGRLACLAFVAAGGSDGERRSHAETLAGIDATFDLFDRGLSGYAIRKER